MALGAVVRSAQSLVVTALALMIVACAGCQASVPDSSADRARTGVPVEIGDGLTVTLESADASAASGATWVVFEIVNSGESSATFPARPVRPTVTDADGEVLDVTGISAEAPEGGGAWGVSASRLGSPYLNPGDSLLVSCAVPSLRTAARPITIVYSPQRAGVATFLIE